MAEIRHAVLLSDPGAGKSTTLRKLEQEQLATALNDLSAPISLYVPLGEWTKAVQSLESFIAMRPGALGRRLGALLRRKPAMLVVSCREQDYTLNLGVDRLLYGLKSEVRGQSTRTHHGRGRRHHPKPPVKVAIRRANAEA